MPRMTAMDSTAAIQSAGYIACNCRSLAGLNHNVSAEFESSIREETGRFSR
jgi:hypothetical protein